MDDLPPGLRDRLASGFVGDGAEAFPGGLEDYLTAKATDRRALTDRLATLALAAPTRAGEIAAAAAAIDAGDFAEADRRLAGVADAPLADPPLAATPLAATPLAEVLEARAEAALLAGDVAAAVARFGAAADLLAAPDTPEGAPEATLAIAASRDVYARRLHAHGARFGRAGLEAAIGLYRMSLKVLTRQAQPLAWAGTQNNLANAFASLGERQPPPETPEAGDIGQAQLGRAAQACRAALLVFEEAAHPLHWATAENNLGAALASLAARRAGQDAPAGAALLRAAIQAFRAAQRVRAQAALPRDWAATEANIARAAEALAAADPPAAARHLRAAQAAFDAALRVLTPAADPALFEMATTARARVRAKLAALEAVEGA